MTVIDDTNVSAANDDISRLETQDWINSFNDLVMARGTERARELLEEIQVHAQQTGVSGTKALNTAYINTIPPNMEPAYPGNPEIEQRIKSLIRWNAMAMVVNANKMEDGIGGHISTFASSATLFQVAFNHFLRGPQHPSGGDVAYLQGHAAPGIYAQAFLEGRLTEKQLHNFRRELAEDGGLSSYPHPWLMPHFWNYPTVSMGLGPIMSIYQARFMRYLEHRNLKEKSDSKVWCFLGDGETDEPETLGALTLASRANLNNLIWVVNCNLQRLDGPVRGNGQIVQELEAIFRGAGWNVIKVLWGREWDDLIDQDRDGLLAKRMGEVVDGEYQKYTVAGGQYIRDHFWGRQPELQKMVEDLTDAQLERMKLGGHDPVKVHAAYATAMRNESGPTVILARTVKGYGLGEAGEGRNISHQQKKLNQEELIKFRDRFNIPISDEMTDSSSFYRPKDDSPEIAYIKKTRTLLGGPVPSRSPIKSDLAAPTDELFNEFFEGTGDREASTTMAVVRILTRLLQDKSIGPRVVPIIPDEARTFGMESLFRQFGIYSPVGQLYDPVDSGTLLPYTEKTDGQILEEGINEAGSLSSFIAAGTSHATYQKPMLPFYIYYSMFGFQRVGDLMWAAGDSRARGFLLGGTAGRTTLSGEGLQHQDGHSHLLASAIPNLISYDPAYAFELAVIIQEGIRRMHEQDEDVFYYITVANENYKQPPLPSTEPVREGIIKGMYKYRESPTNTPAQLNLFGSGAILNEVLKAQESLANEYHVSADVWSVTSYTELHRDALATERWNMLHPDEKPREPYIRKLLGDEPKPVVATSDYVKSIAGSLSQWMPGRFVSLGTDGYGRSESRQRLRDFFEVDSKYVTVASLHALSKSGASESSVVRAAIRESGIDPDKPIPTSI